MARGVPLTKDQVKQVRMKHDEYPTMKNSDIGKLCGVSGESVRRILLGEYDYMFSEGEPPKADTDMSKVVEDIANDVESIKTQMRDSLGVATLEDIVDVLEALTREIAHLGFIAAAYLDPKTSNKAEIAKSAREVFAEEAKGGR